VTYKETFGCYETKLVHYASFDSSSSVASAIEDVTFAPALDAAPSAGCADSELAPFSPSCARQSLIAFTNGQIPLSNPEWQGLDNTLLEHDISPLNILKEVPQPDSQFLYSPLWDIHLQTWTDAAIAAGLDTRQDNFNDAMNQVTLGNATAFGGGPFGPSGFIVNCPVISLDVPPGG
jgi:hypothetical protein